MTTLITAVKISYQKTHSQQKLFQFEDVACNWLHMHQSPSWEADNHSAGQDIYGAWRFITMHRKAKHWIKS
jgi:hypothetical protein